MANDAWYREGICQECMTEDVVITVDADPPLSLCPSCLASLLNALSPELRSEVVGHWDEWSRERREAQALEAAADAVRKRSICIVHQVRQTREVIARALAGRFNADVDHYSSMEGLLETELKYDLIVAYSDFGRKRMAGPRGVGRVRKRNRRVYIIGVSSIPYGEKRLVAAGANVGLLRAGNEIADLTRLISKSGRMRASRAGHEKG